MTEELDKPERRECGDCMMCCKLIGVAEIGKPPCTWCKHVKKGVGCTIYEDRPVSCKEYSCMWLEGLLPEDLKPKTSKVIFHLLAPLEGLGERLMLNIDPSVSIHYWAENPAISVICHAFHNKGFTIFFMHGNSAFMWRKHEPKIRQINVDKDGRITFEVEDQ